MQAAEQLERRRMVLGEQIRKAREAKRWKQKDLAARVHVEPQTISNWERGVRVPDWDKIEILARELGQPATYFIGSAQTEATAAPAAATPDPSLAAEVAESRVLLEAIADALGLDAQQLLRAARPQPAAPQPATSDPALPDEAAESA